MSPPTAGDTTTKPAAASSSTAAIEFEPPLACVRRILKNALPSSTAVGKDASSAFARAAGIFVIYITACANDFARENRRQTITANDVLAAMKELDFDEFTPQLTAFLERHRASEKSKKDAKAKAKEGAKVAPEETPVGEDEPDEENKSKVAVNTPSPSSDKEKLVKETPASPDVTPLGTNNDDMDVDVSKDVEAAKPNDQTEDDAAAAKVANIEGDSTKESTEMEE